MPQETAFFESHWLPPPKALSPREVAALSEAGAESPIPGARRLSARVAVPVWASLSSAGDCRLGIDFTVARNGELTPAFVVRFHGAVHAYVNRWAHRRLKLDWNADEFFDAWGNHLLCATHGARYAPASGAWVAGLVARPVW